MREGFPSLSLVEKPPFFYGTGNIFLKKNTNQTQKLLLLFNYVSKSKLRYFTIDNTNCIFVQLDINSVLWCLYNEALLFRNLIAMVYLQIIYNLKKRS